MDKQKSPKKADIEEKKKKKSEEQQKEEDTEPEVTDNPGVTHIPPDYTEG